jgi:LTXXQ motif family protein
MTWRSIALGSVLTAAVAAGAFYAGVGVGPRPAWAETSGPWSAERHITRGDHGIGRLCDSDDSASLDLLFAYARNRMDLRPDQEPAWRNLESATRSGIASLRAACDKMQAGTDGASAPVRLAAAEVAMTAGAEALRQVRPAFDAFYGTLDDRQRVSLDAALAEGRRHGRHH